MAREDVDEAIESGLHQAHAAGVRGAAVTPFILGHLVDATGGSTLDTNVALAVNNARVAGELASAPRRAVVIPTSDEPRRPGPARDGGRCRRR